MLSLQSSSAKRSGTCAENRRERWCWSDERTLIAKCFAFVKSEYSVEARPRLHSTSGGFSETDVNEFTVRPMQWPRLLRAVTIVTPVANWPKARRKSRLSNARDFFTAGFDYLTEIISPPFITKRTCSRIVTSATGSPSTATMSANLPGSRVPTRSDQPSRSAALSVAD